MTGIGAIVLSLALTTAAEADSPALSTARQTAVAEVGKQSDLVVSLGKQVWEFAETAFQEHKSAELLAATLEKAGFKVRRQVGGMPTAFIAEYGSGKPVLAILAEYDALPGLSQAATTQQTPVPGQTAGHGCGHNLFGAACTGAALAVRRAMDEHRLAGTLRVYGCPAEEGGCGKAYMVREGLFADVDAALHWHPGAKNSAAPRSSLAVIRFRVKFAGRAAHASGSPEKGRSALDGVELMNVGINYLREHVPSTARIHYVITRGGQRPNIVPENAEAWYYIRAPQMSLAQEIFARVKKIAEGAALMSETTQSIHSLTGSYEILPNDPLARLMDANLRAIGVPEFSDAEREFAHDLRETLGLSDAPDRDTGATGPIDTRIARFLPGGGEGSTDVGDVSWVVPTAGLGVATCARGTPGHSWAMTACSGSPLGQRGSLTAAKVLAATAVQIFEEPQTLVGAKEDFTRRKGDVAFKPVLEPGPPPERLDDF